MPKIRTIQLKRGTREKVVKVKPATRENVVLAGVTALAAVISASVYIAQTVEIYRRYRAEQAKADA